MARCKRRCRVRCLGGRTQATRIGDASRNGDPPTRLVGATATIAALFALLPIGAEAQPWGWRLPPGFAPPLVPADNPMTAEKVALGERLFFDPRLSVTGTYSCASCHDPERAFSDGRVVAIGATGEQHTRNTPTLVNAAYAVSFGWLADAPRTLEVQHRIPLHNDEPVELGYPGIDGLDEREVVDALASYVRTLIQADSAFDRYVYYGDDNALSAPAREGLALFLSPRTGCSDCHGGFTLSGPIRHQLAPDTEAEYHDGIRAPTLRNVAVTAPYMHDGSVPTLEAVVTFYDAGGRGEPLEMSTTERASLLAFLYALTDSRYLPNRNR